MVEGWMHFSYLVSLGGFLLSLFFRSLTRHNASVPHHGSLCRKHALLVVFSKPA